MKETTSRPATHLPQYAGRMIPRGGELFVVRWVRRDGRDVRHRYYRRRHDAEAFAARLTAAGRENAVFHTATTWELVA